MAIGIWHPMKLPGPTTTSASHGLATRASMAQSVGSRCFTTCTATRSRQSSRSAPRNWSSRQTSALASLKLRLQCGVLSPSQ